MTKRLDPVMLALEPRLFLSASNPTATPYTVVSTSVPVVQKFIQPLGGVPFRDYGIANYVDLDPTTGIRDYRGGIYTYDGHTGIDFAFPNFSSLDKGFQVVSVADGTVTAVHDGEYDRQTSFNTNNINNSVTVDIGNGYTVTYDHFRTGTVGVYVGEHLVQGQVIGLVGSSGYSTGTHLHFELDYNGSPVETYLNPSQYWIAPLPYQGDVNAITDSGVTTYNPATDLGAEERPADSGAIAATPGQLIYYWATGFQSAGSSYDVQFVQPDGSVYLDSGPQMLSTANRGGYTYFDIALNGAPELGAWQARISDNGQLLAVKSFIVAASGTPTLGLTNGSTDIPDTRSTPVDFGSVALDGTPGQQAFTLTNLGSAPLDIGAVSAPAGFNVVQSPSGELQPGGTATLVLSASTTTAGTRYGIVSIPNNSSENPFTFAVSSTITPTNGTPAVTVITRDPNASTSGQVPAVFTFQRAGDLSAALTVNYSVSGSAVAGTDFIPLSGQITIPAGAASADVVLEPSTTYSSVSTRTVTVSITPGSYSTDSSYASATATIAPPFAVLSNGILTITGTAASDTIVVTDNAGSVVVSMNNVLSQSFNSVSGIAITGGAGDDSISISDVPIASTIGGGGGNDSITGGSLNDSLKGGKGDDTLGGAGGNDTIVGGGDNDSLKGGGGNDSIATGPGNDTVKGGTGNDTLLGGPGNDILSGNAGNDSIVAGAGSSSLIAGPGSDILTGSINSGDQPDTITLTSGDSVTASAHDSILGRDGTDTVHIV